MNTIEYSDFEKVDLRVGTILRCELFPEARKPAYKLWIDFGSDIGIKKSSAQITQLYKPEDLINKQVIAVLNFMPRQIGPFISEVLVLGVHNRDGHVQLLSVDGLALNGARVS